MIKPRVLGMGTEPSMILAPALVFCFWNTVLARVKSRPLCLTSSLPRMPFHLLPPPSDQTQLSVENKSRDCAFNNENTSEAPKVWNLEERSGRKIMATPASSQGLDAGGRKFREPCGEQVHAESMALHSFLASAPPYKYNQVVERPHEWQPQVAWEKSQKMQQKFSLRNQKDWVLVTISSDLSLSFYCERTVLCGMFSYCAS